MKDAGGLWTLQVRLSIRHEWEEIEQDFALDVMVASFILKRQDGDGQCCRLLRTKSCEALDVIWIDKFCRRAATGRCYY